MPILPENKKRYPKNWPEIRERILTRAGQIRNEKGEIIQEACCEWCKAENHLEHPLWNFYVILTVAHMDHTPENCSDDNLFALCQKCHNRYDAPERAKNRKKRKEAKKNEIHN